MSTTKRVTVNFPSELYQAATSAIDGVHYLSVTQVVLIAVDNLVRQASSSPLPSSPLHPPTPNSTPFITPPLVSPKGDTYSPPSGGSIPPKKKVRTLPKEYTKEFQGFWSLYPRKIQKKHAFKAYWSALRVATDAEILDGLEKHIDQRIWKDKQFIPYPATWLNRGGWEVDEAEIPKRKPRVRKDTPVDFTKALDGPSCDLWADSIEDFYDAFDPTDVRDWFTPVRGIVHDGTLVLGCPDKAHALWMTKHYRDSISTAVGIRWKAVDAEEFAGMIA